MSVMFFDLGDSRRFVQVCYGHFDRLVLRGVLMPAGVFGAGDWKYLDPGRHPDALFVDGVEATEAEARACAAAPVGGPLRPRPRGDGAGPRRALRRLPRVPHPMSGRRAVLLWSASRSTLAELGGPEWLRAAARNHLVPLRARAGSGGRAVLVTGDAASDDVAWAEAGVLGVDRVRYRKDGAVEGDGVAPGRLWLPGGPRPLPTDAAGWRRRLLARDAWMAHNVARAAGRGDDAVCVAAIDPRSQTQGAAFTAARAEALSVRAVRLWFRRHPGPLRVRTARVSYGGEDRLDVTRKGADRLGVLFAPSDVLLWPAKREMKAADEVERAGAAAAAEAMRAAAWARYAPRYRDEMAASYTKHRAAWERVLGSGEVTLVCYCASPERCHRRLLAEMLVKCGAIYEGEVGATAGMARASGAGGGAR